MRVTRSMIDEAVAGGILSDQQAWGLWNLLIQKEQETLSFKPAHILYYLGHLSDTIFKDSMLFTVALSALGLAIIGAGIYWQRHEVVIGERLRSCLPAGVRDRIAHHA